MKILVALKQVRARFVSKNRRLRTLAGRSRPALEINEPDAYALEEALQLKEKHGGEVVVLCAGPDRASSSIREALAKGADRAIHIDGRQPWKPPTPSACRSSGRAHGQAEQPDLVLTGLQSDDLGCGQTGVVMAELLGMPHATIIMEVEGHRRRPCA